MNDKPVKEINFQDYASTIFNTAMQVITDPVGFYRYMQRGGGYVEPLIFMVVMGVVSGILQTLLSVFGLGMTGALFAVGASIILVPIFVVIFGFVGAGILFVIWKLLGSQQPYECAFRCAAYAGAISPITTLVNIIPYLGPVVALAWMAYLMVVASVEVHNIAMKTAWIVFGVLFAVFALINISSQMTARKYARDIDKWGKEMGKIDQMSPEEAGKKVGEFLKGMQEGAGKKTQ